MHVRSARGHARTFPVRRVILWLSIAVISIGAIVSIAIANRSVSSISESTLPYSQLSVGDPAPLFSVATTQGAFSLDAAHRPVFLEVFATWCPHCQRETAVLNRLYEKYEKRVDFVAVSGSPYAHDRTSPESMPDVLGFVQYFRVQYPVAFDASLAVAGKYLQGGYPTIAIIGSDKRIAYIGSGEIAETKLDSAIRGALQR
jgi:cytochrome c biogenesis protein CcmG, thiol:disulfide interchange protein DsbE